jgi:signal transduction histidine kinase
MSLPRRKNSIAPRLNSLPGNLSQLQRRKQARRQRISSQSRSMSISNSKVPQFADGYTRRRSAQIINEQPIGQSYGRELFLQAIVEACAASIAVLDESGRILFVSNSWRLSAEKYAPQGEPHPLGLNGLERSNRLNSRPSNHTSALAEDIQAILDGNIREFHNEYSCPSVSGSSWFVVHAARLDLPEAAGAFRVLVNSSDVTHARQAEETLRDLGGRLITAQEEERSRVARELHDDLNQRMALLSIELEQLSQTMPENQSLLRSSIHSVWERAQEISAEIHRVSYQLHPAKLDHLGLVAAVKSLCLELGAHHEIKIAFKEKGCGGSLPKDVTLCLFRIIQESFRNIIKHSGAREARVALVGTPHAIQLSVSDNGRGFDVGSMESKRGLGLISMRERLRSVGGVISIHSTARGTRIEVSVPVAGSDIRAAEISLPELERSAYCLPPLSICA